MSHIILDLVYKANPDVTDLKVRKIVDIDKSRAYVVGYGQDDTTLDDDWITSTLTTINMSSGFNLAGAFWVEVESVSAGEFANYETQGAEVVEGGLRNMDDFWSVDSPEHLNDVFTRWMERGIEIAALHSNDLSRPYVTPDHALPKNATLLVGDGAQSVAEVINRVANGYVWNVGVCTLTELRDLMIESMELDDEETIWDMLELLYGSDHTGIEPWECPDHIDGVIGNDDLLDVADVRHLF